MGKARTVSKASYETLIPTLRKPGSEIWVSFNPEPSTDETYQRFVVKPPPSEVDGKPWARIVEVGYRDNPWFPQELAIEAALLKESDPDAYATVYGGKPRQYLDGAIYANDLGQLIIAMTTVVGVIVYLVSMKADLKNLTKSIHDKHEETGELIGKVEGQLEKLADVMVNVARQEERMDAQQRRQDTSGQRISALTNELSRLRTFRHKRRPERRIIGALKPT